MLLGYQNNKKKSCQMLFNFWKNTKSDGNNKHIHNRPNHYLEKSLSLLFFFTIKTTNKYSAYHHIIKFF